MICGGPRAVAGGFVLPPEGCNILKMKKLGVIIPAGGNGTRMSRDEGQNGLCDAAISVADSVAGPEAGASTRVPKQFMLLDGEPVLAHVIGTFRSVAPDADIVVALPADRIGQWRELCTKYNIPAHTVCRGGAGRFESVRNALAGLHPGCEYIAVHDAARPLVSAGLILHTVEVAQRHGSAIPVVPLTDSIRSIVEMGGGEAAKEGSDRVSEAQAEDLAAGADAAETARGAGVAGAAGAVVIAGATPATVAAGAARKTEQPSESPFEKGLEVTSHPQDRERLRAVQTPQVFRADILRDSYERAGDGEGFTDDATVVEAAGYSVMLCEGERRNLKITEPEDLTIAESLLRQKS